MLGAKGNHRFGHGAALVEVSFWGGEQGRGLPKPLLNDEKLDASPGYIQLYFGAPCLVGPRCMKIRVRCEKMLSSSLNGSNYKCWNIQSKRKWP